MSKPDQAKIPTKIGWIIVLIDTEEVKSPREPCNYQLANDEVDSRLK